MSRQRVLPAKSTNGDGPGGHPRLSVSSGSTCESTPFIEGLAISCDIRNLWVCDGSVFPTVGGVNPSLTIQAVALRTADRIEVLARRGEL